MCAAVWYPPVAAMLESTSSGRTDLGGGRFFWKSARDDPHGGLAL